MTSEWYVQDNWRVTRRLTLDYGMRFYHMPATVDHEPHGRHFRSPLYNPAQAPVLYRSGTMPRCAVAHESASLAPSRPRCMLANSFPEWGTRPMARPWPESMAIRGVSTLHRPSALARGSASPTTCSATARPPFAEASACSRKGPGQPDLQPVRPGAGHRGSHHLLHEFQHPEAGRVQWRSAMA